MTEVRRRADFVEDLFAGVVAAGYNFFFSVVTLLRSPVRGAGRLAVRRQLPRFAQLAPHTLIVLIFCVAYPMLLSTTDDLKLGESMREFLLRRSVERSMTILVLRATCFAVAVDIFARFFAYCLFPNNRRRSGRAATLVLYAYAAALLYILLAGIAVHIYAPQFIETWRTDDAVTAIFALVTLIVAPLPIAEVMAGNLPKFRYPTVLRGAFLGLVAASLAGALLFSDIVGRWAARRREDPPLVREVRCEIDASRMVSALVVIHNTGSDPIMLTRDQEILFQEYATNVTVTVPARIADASLGANHPMYVLSPGATAWLRVVGSAPVDHAGPPRRLKCTLPGFPGSPQSSAPMTVE